MSDSIEQQSGIYALALSVERCVDIGHEPHASAMVAMYFGIMVGESAPELGSAMRRAFERTFAESGGGPQEAIEAQFRNVINQMRDVYDKHRGAQE